MRLLGIGGYNSLGDLYWRLSRQGVDVRVFVQHEEAHGIFRGMVQRVDDWRAQLDWIRAAGENGLIVFETADQGDVIDGLRGDGFNVVGGSEAGNRLELDRAFGQAVLRDAGLQIAAVHDFTDFDSAIAFVDAHPARYVFKINDAEASSARNYVGEMDDGADVRALLQMEQRRGRGKPSFVLMEHLQGVEVGVGAYFNGESFLAPACLDWEHKRFFPGDLGELTGEMGTVVTYRGYERIFGQTLARMRDFLRDARYRGYINLNTIINARGIWPLEFTCRFGYPGFAICDALHRDGWWEILQKMALGRDGSFATHPGYSVGVVLTVPPFPHEHGYAQLSRGMPILFRDGTTMTHPGLHWGEAGLEGDQLVAAGSLGYLCVATGRGADIKAAREEAYALSRQVVTPNLRYRHDIGERFLREDYAALQALGYLD